MHNLLLTAILLGLVGMLANGEYFLGSSMLSRPLVTGFLTGIILGDIKAGIIMGATLELAFIGNFSIGASIPPEIISGAVLGTAFALQTGGKAGVAVALALPIASLVLVIKNLCFTFVLPMFVHKADDYAAKGDSRGVSMMNVLGGFSINLPIGLVIAISYYLGSSVVQGLINSIPAFITNGLSIATGLLPAYGFALLANQMLNKKTAVFLLLGFVLAAYGKLPVTAVSIVGLILAFILTGYSSYNGGKDESTQTGGVSYDEEF